MTQIWHKPQPLFLPSAAPPGNDPNMSKVFLRHAFVISPHCPVDVFEGSPSYFRPCVKSGNWGENHTDVVFTHISCASLLGDIQKKPWWSHELVCERHLFTVIDHHAFDYASHFPVFHFLIFPIRTFSKEIVPLKPSPSHLHWVEIISQECFSVSASKFGVSLSHLMSHPTCEPNHESNKVPEQCNMGQRVPVASRAWIHFRCFTL